MQTPQKGRPRTFRVGKKGSRSSGWIEIGVREGAVVTVVELVAGGAGAVHEPVSGQGLVHPNVQLLFVREIPSLGGCTGDEGLRWHSDGLHHLCDHLHVVGAAKQGRADDVLRHDASLQNEVGFSKSTNKPGHPANYGPHMQKRCYFTKSTAKWPQNSSKKTVLENF